VLKPLALELDASLGDLDRQVALVDATWSAMIKGWAWGRSALEAVQKLTV
jgi:hypothetical protein